MIPDRFYPSTRAHARSPVAPGAVPRWTGPRVAGVGRRAAVGDQAAASIEGHVRAICTDILHFLARVFVIEAGRGGNRPANLIRTPFCAPTRATCGLVCARPPDARVRRTRRREAVSCPWSCGHVD